MPKNTEKALYIKKKNRWYMIVGRAEFIDRNPDLLRLEPS